MFDEISELGTCSLCGAYTKLIEGGWCEVCDSRFEDTKDPQRAAKGCCLGLLLSIPIWICIVVTLVKLF